MISENINPNAIALVGGIRRGALLGGSITMVVLADVRWAFYTLDIIGNRR